MTTENEARATGGEEPVRCVCGAPAFVKSTPFSYQVLCGSSVICWNGPEVIRRHGSSLSMEDIRRLALGEWTRVMAPARAAQEPCKHSFRMLSSPPTCEHCGERAAQEGSDG